LAPLKINSAYTVGLEKNENLRKGYMMSTQKNEILAPEYGALFPIHQSFRFSDRVIKDNKKTTSSTLFHFSGQENIIHTHRK
jgi:hypothetical protein